MTDFPTVLKEKQDFEDLLEGSILMGSGGGGPKCVAKAIINQIIDKKLSVTVLDVADLDEKKEGAIVAGMGAPSADTSSQKVGSFKAQKIGFLQADLNVEMILAAVKKAWEELGKRRAKTFDYVISIEVGAGNTFVPLLIAAEENIPIVNSSGADRAVPQLSQLTFTDVEMGQVVMASASNGEEKGATVILEPSTAEKAESLMRSVVNSRIFENFAGIALWQMNGATLKKVGVANVLAEAWSIGRAVRLAKESGGDPVQAAIKAMKGYELFRGCVKEKKEEAKGGFDFGKVTIHDEKGQEMILYVQNESNVAWLSTTSQPLGLLPDKISYLRFNDDSSVEAISNAELKKCNNVVVLGSPTCDKLREEKRVRHFKETLENLGYGGPYVHIEDLNP